MTGPILVEPLAGPVVAEVRVPGSKSHTNRAVLCAALARGSTALAGVLRADDTEVMLRAATGLGAQVLVQGEVVTVHGTGGARPDGADGARRFHVGLSGTTARFLAPVLAWRGIGDVLDGEPPLQARPMGPGLEALRALGASVATGPEGRLPATFAGPPITGGTVQVAGDVSSQFLSGLLLAGPVLQDGIEVALTTDLVSRPYLDLTLRTMADFGAQIDIAADGDRYRVAGSGYVAPDPAYRLEPDASAASYFFALAALTGSTITVPGLGPGAVQGDLAFVGILERMGATARRAHDAITVTGTGSLRGVDVDLRHCSDVAQTLATTAVFAQNPTRVRGIGFIRRKETDRIGHVVAELRRCGVEAHEHDDGFTVVPGRPRPATVRTYSDHRMAMSFALLGLRAPGILIADPDCVSKTYPAFWDELRALGQRAHDR